MFTSPTGTYPTIMSISIFDELNNRWFMTEQPSWPQGSSPQTITEERDVVKSRNAGISRNMAEYHGVFRNMAEYHGISRHFYGIYRNITMRQFINMDVWQHILLQKWWIFLILTVSNKQQLYTGSFICGLYHYYECSPNILNQYD
jgi:hypothetical protein